MKQEYECAYMYDCLFTNSLACSISIIYSAYSDIRPECLRGEVCRAHEGASSQDFRKLELMTQSQGSAVLVSRCEMRVWCDVVPCEIMSVGNTYTRDSCDIRAGRKRAEEANMEEVYRGHREAQPA